MYSTGYVHAPLPRRRQPSSTSSTLLTPSEGSEWMPRASTSTSRSIFSDGEDTHKGDGDEMTEVGTVHMGKMRDEQPLIDFGDDHPDPGLREEEVGPTPGDKLRMLLRQMEAEVRSTTTATPIPTRRLSFQDQRDPEESFEEEEEVPIPKSHWREGRRIGALPKERSYSPVASPERRRSDQKEEEEVDDSPPTPPLRITNPYLYNNRRVSDERRSVSPRISSRAAVLHASTSKSPPAREQTHRSHLETYLARAPTSPSRKGKERASTPEPSPRIARNKGKTPRKWSVEIAPDDSVLFAEGIPEEDGVELDIDESVEPPWDETDDDVEEEEEEEGEGELELPALPEIPASYEDGDSSEEEVVPVVRPESRMRSRFSHSLSTERSRTPLQPRQSPSNSKDQSDSNSRSKSINDQSMSFTTARTTSLKRSTRSIPQIQDDQSNSRSINDPSTSFTTAKTTSLNRSARPNPPPQDDHDSPSRSINNQSTSFTTAKTTSLNRSTRPVPPPQPIFPQEIQVGMTLTPPPRMATPPKANLSVPGQTPKPPGAWLSTSKPARPKIAFTPSPTPLRNGDTSIHRIKIPHSTRRSPNTSMSVEEGDISITQRLISMTKNLAFSSTSTKIPKPSTTLSEARESLAKAAEASAAAQRRVEVSQRQWLEALSVSEVVRQGWTWGKWGWWVSMEILLLWGVFRVTLEYAQVNTSRPFDTPSYALAIPLPTAVSAFVIPSTNRRSANFFDLLEGLEVWRILGGEGDVGWGRIPT